MIVIPGGTLPALSPLRTWHRRLIWVPLAAIIPEENA